MSRRALPLFLGVAFFTAFLVTRAGAESCPSNNVPITPETRDAATAAGIPASADCWNPNDQNTGTAAGEAKLWLQQHATKNSNIMCMNATFAEKLKSFMEAVPGGPPVITDGYRDPSKQAALVQSGASRAGYCMSYHNYGLAADFNNNTRTQTAWMRANSTKYGINVIGDWDPNHFQDADGRYGQCGACSNDAGNGALPGVQTQQYPDDYKYYTQNPSLLPQPQPAFQPLMPLQPTQAAQPSQTTPVQPIQYQQPTTSLSDLLLSGNNLNLSTTTSSGTTTANDLLNLLRGSTSTQNPNYPAVSLNSSLSQGAQLQPTPTPSAYVPQGGVPIIAAQQTFTSSDLSGNPIVGTPVPPSSPIQQILASAKAILVNILSFLQRA